MDKIDVLRKAVAKAKKQGYFPTVNIDAMLFDSKNLTCHDDTIKSRDYLEGSFCYYKIIYNHRFAESFWGKDWQTHLQNMVILAEPIEYLNKFVNPQEAKVEVKTEVKPEAKPEIKADAASA